jgi:hypothetical protein
MANSKRAGNLEVAQDMQFQEKEWVVERWGWIIGFVLILAALAGLFGEGPLARASAAAGPLEVRYERFVRFDAPTELLLQAQSGSEANVTVWFDRDYLQNVQVERIVPEPDLAYIDQNRIYYQFQTANPEETVQITFHLMASHFGLMRAQIGQDTVELPLEIQQVVYP